MVQNGEISLPWHLLYLGDKDLRDTDFNPFEESGQLLGMRRPVVYHVLAEPQAERQGTRKKFLLTVGKDIPGHPDVGSSTKKLMELIDRSFPDSEFKTLYTLFHHDSHLRGKQADDDFWFVLSHGGKVVGPFSQRNLRLSAEQSIDGVYLKQCRQASESSVFQNASCAMLLSCRSGILSKDWDLPEMILTLGASSVIAPHTDISMSASIELAEVFFETLKEGALPSIAFIKAQQVGDLPTRLHSNLFSIILADEGALETFLT